MKKIFKIILLASYALAGGSFSISCAQKPTESVKASTVRTTEPATASSTPAADGTRQLVCPKDQLLSSNILNQKPASSEDLVRYAAKPPVVSATGEWSINSLAPRNESLYLGCYYTNKKILTFRLPLQKEFCIAKENSKHLHVECIKK